MKKLKTDANDWATSNSKNTLRLSYWTLAWVVTSGVAAFGPKLIWNFESLPTILGVLVNLGAGFGMIAANKKYLNGLDELQQKIFLEAGALALGVGLVCGCSYELLEDIKLIPFQPEIPHIIILMCLTFLAGMISGQRKYQ
ncbi:MAG TPA: hypothetical protein EYQ50_01320 [Verrucomicrobiales bacterium]|nr:hypothetical protein [Verrucomicrobiales bacterium]HIL70429.1 hypothetical protein [Verrucomicrobiota bacterium]